MAELGKSIGNLGTSLGGILPGVGQPQTSQSTQQTQGQTQQGTSGQQSTGGTLPGVNPFKDIQDSNKIQLGNDVKTNVPLPGIITKQAPTATISQASTETARRGYQRAKNQGNIEDMRSINEQLHDEMLGNEYMQLFKQGVKQTWDTVKKRAYRFGAQKVEELAEHPYENTLGNMFPVFKPLIKKLDENRMANPEVKKTVDEGVNTMWNSYYRYENKINNNFAEWVDKNMNKILSKEYQDSGGLWESIKSGDSDNIKYGLMESFSSSALPMLPGIIAGFVTKNPTVTATIAFASTAPIEDQYAYEEAMKEGATREEAEAIGKYAGMINGALETAGEFLQLKGMLKPLKKNITKEITKKTTRQIIFKGLKEWASGIFGEGLTEGTQELVTNALIKTVNEDKDIWENVMDSIVAGGALGAGGSTLGAGGVMIEEHEKNKMIDMKTDIEAMNYVMGQEERKNQRMSDEQKEKVKERIKNRRGANTWGEVEEIDNKFQKTEEENSGFSNRNEYSEGRNIGWEKDENLSTNSMYVSDTTISENSSHGDRMTTDSFFETDENGEYIEYDDGSRKERIYAGGNKTNKNGSIKSQFTEKSKGTPRTPKLKKYYDNFYRLVKNLSNPNVKVNDYVQIGKTGKGKNIYLSKGVLAHIIEDHGVFDVNTLIESVNNPTGQKWESETTKTGQGQHGTRPYMEYDIGSEDSEIVIGIKPDSWEKDTDTAEYYGVVSMRESNAPTTPADDVKFQLKYEEKGYTPGVANKKEKNISGKEGIKQKNTINDETIEQLAEKYGVKVEVIKGMIEILKKGKGGIIIKDGEAYGKYRDQLLTLSEQIKESTAPHELLHAIFDMIDPETKVYLISQVMKSEGWNAKTAEERLADSFSNFFLTGKIEGAPKSTWGRIKIFFKRVRSFINGMNKWRNELEEIFTDIITADGIVDLQSKIDESSSLNKSKERMRKRFMEYRKNAIKTQERAESENKYQKKQKDEPRSLTDIKSVRTTDSSLPNSITIDDENSSVILDNLNFLVNAVKDEDPNAKQFTIGLQKVFGVYGKSTYIYHDINGETYTLRVSNHHVHANQAKETKSPLKNNTSVAIILEIKDKKQSVRNGGFRSDKDVDYVEFSYNENDLNSNKMLGIIKGVRDWVNTGRYTDKNYNNYYVSPKGSDEKFQLAGDINSPAFKKRFGDSKVVDKDGNPLVVYHGTRYDIKIPNMKKGRRQAYGGGMYFTTNKQGAEHYANEKKNLLSFLRKPRVMEVYLSIQNPIKEGVYKWDNKWIDELKKLGYEVNEEYLSRKNVDIFDKYFHLRMLQDKKKAINFTEDFSKVTGYDGLVAPQSGGEEYWVAFKPSQVKSATDNVGTYDANNDDIRYQKMDDEYAEAVENGNTARAKEILKEYAKEKGYLSPEDYKGKGAWTAPSASVDRKDFRNLDAIREQVDESWESNLYAVSQGIHNQPDDYFGSLGARYYSYDDKTGMQSYYAIKKVIDNINAQIREHGEVVDMPVIEVYRAVPDYKKKIDTLQKDLELFTFDKEGNPKLSDASKLSEEGKESYERYKDQEERGVIDNADKLLYETTKGAQEISDKWTVKEGMLQSGGEWVSPSIDYAKEHGMNRFDGNYKIIKEKVPADELWWDGNDIREWGFDDGRDYVTKGVKNSRKQLEITYDNNGNLIPLSKRFNEETSDTRYQRTDDKLINLHNLSMENLRKSKRLGGFPMPSIAITKEGVPHTSYGDISVIFKKDTVDPSKNKANKLFGVDAYTPTVPRIVAIPKNTKEADKIIDKIQDETGLSYGEVLQWIEYKEDYERYYPELLKYSDLHDKVADYKIFDGYTPAGKRRYLDYNLENLVKKMKKTDTLGAFGNFGNLVGAEKGKVKSIEDVRAMNFAPTNLEEYRELFKEYSDNLREFYNNVIRGDSPLGYDMFSRLVESTYNKDDNKRLNKLNEEVFDQFLKRRITLDDVKKIHDPIKRGAEMVRPYAEAKPERAVGFDEVGAIVVPNEQLEEARELMKDTGVEVYGYAEGERMNVIDAVADDNGLRYQKAGDTNSEAFKKRFNGSKIVDSDGKPLRVYHGTHGDFTVFDREKIGSKTKNKGIFGEGFYFTSTRKNGEYYASKGWNAERKEGKVMELYLSIKNPLMWNNYKTPQDVKNLRKELKLPESVLKWDAWGNDIHPLVKPEQSIRFREALEKAGYDGVWYFYEDGKTDEIVAFYPNQIKSATDNVGTYDANNDDIRFQKAGDTKSANFKKRFGDSKIVNEDGSPKIMYHGTPTRFTIFDKSKIGDNTGNYGYSGDGFYFTDSKDYAGSYGNNVMEVYLKVEKPFTFTKENIKKYAKYLTGVEQGHVSLDKDWVLKELKRNDEKSYDFAMKRLDNPDNAWKTTPYPYDMKYDPNNIVDLLRETERDGRGYEFESVNLDYFKGFGKPKYKDDVYYYPSDPAYMMGLGEYSNQEFIDAIRKDGFDGIITFGEVVVFDSNQVKSATDNVGTYDPNNDDIRYQKTEYEYDENGNRKWIKFGDNSEFDPSIFGENTKEEQIEEDKENEKSNPFYNAWIKYNNQNYKDDQLTLGEFVDAVGAWGERKQEEFDKRKNDIAEVENDPKMLELQLKAVKLAEEETNVGKKFGKNVSKEVRDRQQAEVEKKREDLAKEIFEWMYPGLKFEDATYDDTNSAWNKEAEWEMLGREKIEEKLKYFKKDSNGNWEKKNIKLETPQEQREKIEKSGNFDEVIAPSDRVIEWKTPEGQKGRLDKAKDPKQFKKVMEKINSGKSKTKVELKDVTNEVRALERYKENEKAEKERRKKEKQEEYAKKKQEEYKRNVRLKAFQRLVDMQRFEKFPFLSEDEIKQRWGFTDEEWKKITEQLDLGYPPKKRNEKAVSDFNKAVDSEVKFIIEGLSRQNKMKQKEAEKNLGEIGDIDLDVLLGKDEEKGQKEVEEFERIAKEEKGKSKKEKNKRLEQAREDVTQVEIDKERENSKSEKERVDKIIKSTKSDKTVWGNIKEFASDIVTPVSTRLKEISPKIYRELMKYFQNKDILTNQRLKEIDPFLKALGKIRKENPVRFMDIWVALANRNIGYANGLLQEYGVKVPTKLLDTIYDEAEDVGLNINYLGSYYPLSVKAPQSFMEELMKSGNGDIASEIEKKIQEESVKKGGPLDESEVTAIINSVIAGEEKGPDVNVGNKHLKKRNTEIERTAKMLEYCDDPISTLIGYIEGMTQSIERAKFLGKSRSGNVHTLADYVYNAKNGLTAEQQDELMELLKSVFNDAGTHPAIQVRRDIATLTTLGSPSSTLTQISDLSFSVYENGWKEALKAVWDIFMKRKAFDLQDMGVINRGEEYTNINSQKNLLQKAIHNVFKLTFFSKFDTFGKSTFIQSTWNKRRKRALKGENGDPQLIKDIMKITDDEYLTYKIINDLRNGVFSEEVALVMYMKLGNVQPLTKAQMPKAYLDNPNGRLFYQFKTFGIKQMDYVIQETKENLKGWKNLSTTEKFLRVAQIANMVFTMTLFGLVGDELKDITMRRRSNSLILRWLFGEDVGTEQVWDKTGDNILKLFGLSRYSIMQMKNGNWDKAISDIFLSLPAMRTVDNIASDIHKAFNNDGSINWRNPSAYQAIPVIGKYRYWIYGGGQDKQQEALDKEKKTTTSGGSSRSTRTTRKTNRNTRSTR